MVCWSSVVTAVSQAEIYIALIVALHGAVLAMRLHHDSYPSELRTLMPKAKPAKRMPKN